MGYSPYSEIINKMQKEIEMLREMSGKNQNDIFYKQQSEIAELNNKLYKANNKINSLKNDNEALKKKNYDLHMSFVALENAKLKDENTNLKNENGFLQISIDTINSELQQLKEIMAVKTKNKKTSNRKRTWGLSPTEHKKLRTEVLERDNYTCQICGCKANPLHVHHIKERQHGGTNDKYNLLTLCPRCHAEQHRGEPVHNLMRKCL